MPGAGRARSRDPGRVLLPAPEDTGFENAQQAILIERYTTGNYCVRDSTVTYMPVISGELVLGHTVVSGLAGLRPARRGAAGPVVGPAVSVHRQRRRASRCLTRRG